MDLRPLACLALTLVALSFGSAHAQTCTRDEQCQDGSWCNGVERCEGGQIKGMCMPAPRPMCSSKKVCDENGKRCLTPAKVDKLLTPCAEGETYDAKSKKCVPGKPL